MNDISPRATSAAPKAVRKADKTSTEAPPGATADKARSAPDISVNPTEFRLEDYLPYRLSLLSNTVSQGIAHRYQQDHDISVTEWRVIVMLGRYPGSTASEVVERTAMDKVSISRAVHSLIEKGFLQRRTDPDDRRRMRLYLTRGRGKEVLESIVPLAAAYETELLETMNPKERAALEALLIKLQNSAEALRQRLIV